MFKYPASVLFLKHLIHCHNEIMPQGVQQVKDLKESSFLINLIMQIDSFQKQNTLSQLGLEVLQTHKTFAIFQAN